jgi:hypothetical protein
MNTNADRLRNSNIPFINLSKENLILIYDSLEAEQAGNMLFKLTEYLYQGTEPTFDTKIEKSVWNNVMLLVNRKAEGYFTKAEVARENGKKGGRPRKTQPQQDVKEEATEISHISPSEGIKKENDIQMPNEDLKPTEAVKSTINGIIPNEFMDGLNDNTTEEENLKDMGTFIGDFKELNSKTTTPNVEEEFDNFSDELNDLLDANEAKTEQIAQAKYLRKYLGIKNDAAYELSIKYYNQLKEQLTTEKDIEDLNKYLREKAEMKHNR